MFLRYLAIRLSMCGLSRNVYRHLEVGKLMVTLGGGPFDMAAISGRGAAISLSCMIQYLWSETVGVLKQAGHELS